MGPSVDILNLLLPVGDFASEPAGRNQKWTVHGKYNQGTFTFVCVHHLAGTVSEAELFYV
jgi:hypothetical protein